MDKTRWTKIRGVFTHLSDQSPSFRDDYLDMVCEDDTDLRLEIENMLQAHDDLARDELVHDKTGKLAKDHSADNLFEESLSDKKIGACTIEQTIGSGGMGIVYRASHPKFGLVAVKTLPQTVADHPLARVRLEREAKILTTLSHPSLCRVHELLQHEHSLALVLELIDGKDLDVYVEEQSISTTQALSIARDVASALSLTHDNGIVHRDIKPSNVLITHDQRTKLIDFGIAHITAARLTYTGELLGSPAYMAPEQWNNDPIDGRTDIWSLGALLCFLCSGKPAFTGKSVADCAKAICQSPPDPWPDDRLLTNQQQRAHQLMLRMIEKDPAARPDSIQSVFKELESLLSLC